MSGANTTRPGFVRAFLKACEALRDVPERPDDLIVLDDAIKRKTVPPIVALTHFEIAERRATEFDDDLFFALRHLIESRKLTLLSQLLRGESRLAGEWAYLLGFKQNEVQSPPEDVEVAASLRRRELVHIEGDAWRIRVPLFQRWLLMQ